jgi:hypothetical protein
MICDQCGNEFMPTVPARAEQRFCSQGCRTRWHYLVRKQDRYEAEIERAEERMNGHAPHHEVDVRSLLASVRPPPPLNFKRRI